MLSFVDEVVLSCNTESLSSGHIHSFGWPLNEGRRRWRVSSNDLLNFWLNELCCWYDDDRRQRGKTVESQVSVIVRFHVESNKEKANDTEKKEKKVEDSWDDDDGDIVYVEDANWVLPRALLQCNSFHLEMENPVENIYFHQHHYCMMMSAVWLTYVFQLHRIIKNQRCGD